MSRETPFLFHRSIDPSSSSSSSATIEHSSSTESIMDTTSKVLQRNLRMKNKEVVVPAIGEDMIMEILLHLPPVSVLRFKSVSKSWYSLISDPSFFRNHAAQFHLSQLLHPLMEPPGLLLSPTSDFPDYEKNCVYTVLSQDQDQEPPDSSYLKVFLDHALPAFEQNFLDCYLIDSCNGLLLYHTESGTPNQYTVFNPITNQYKQVPLMNLLKTFIKPNEEEEEEKKTMVCDHPHIVFDPSISLSYKVLTLVHKPPYTHFQLYVYSDDDIGSWKHLTNIPNKYITSRNTFMFNGVFFWLCHRHSICFDFVNETASLLSLPPAPAECPNCDVLYFGEFGGRIRLIQEYRACSFDIMEWEPGSRIWTGKRVNLGLDQDTSDPFKRVVVKVMHLYKTEKGEEVALLNVDYQWVVSFNITNNTLGKELTIPYIENLDCLNAFPFTPTLCPLLM